MISMTVAMIITIMTDSIGSITVSMTVAMGSITVAMISLNEAVRR